MLNSLTESQHIPHVHTEGHSEGDGLRHRMKYSVRKNNNIFQNDYIQKLYMCMFLVIIYTYFYL